MKLIHYPEFAHLMEMSKKLTSPHLGITKWLATPLHDESMPFLRCITTEMANIHKFLLGPDSEMQYHLSGYGIFYEECLVKVLSESIERYSHMVYPKTAEGLIEYTTYRKLTARGENVVDFNLLRLYSDKTYVALEQADLPFKISRPSVDDTTGWIECQSLLNSNRRVWLPAHCLLVGYVPNKKKDEKWWLPGFSTGTASHVTMEQALLNAILEFVEIDAYMAFWYSKRASPEIILDSPPLLKEFGRLFSAKSPYAVTPLYLTLPDMPVHVVGFFLVNKKGDLPLLVSGAQAGLNPANTFYRGLCEAVAILYLGIYGYVYMPAMFLLTRGYGRITDLDSNVAYFADPTDKDKKTGIMQQLRSGEKMLLSSLDDLSEGSVRSDLRKVLGYVKNVSECAAYLDITPPIAEELGFSVARVFIPELLNMCMPSFPCTLHPRVLKYGGVKNEYPHPLP